MNRKMLLLFIVTYTGIFGACGTKDLLPTNNNETMAKASTDKSTIKWKEDMLTPNSPLLAPVDKSIQDSVIKRIQMDLNPDIEHYRNTGQSIRNNIPDIDFSSLEFIPVIARPRILFNYQGESLLWVDKEFAYMYGKAKNGENIYIKASYEDKSAGMNPHSYQNVLQATGQEKANSINQKFLNRKGIDNWRIIVITNAKILDYARSQSDDGKFFILTQGKHHFEVCYFKDGKPMSCRGGSGGKEIVIRDFASLMR